MESKRTARQVRGRLAESTQIASRVDEFGDFQTPVALAEQVCALLRSRGARPASLLEPTCGVGNLLCAAVDAFPSLRSALGVELNREYVRRAKERMKLRGSSAQAEVVAGNFFDADWRVILNGLPEPILVLGNPPWVTNSALSVVESSNLPRKSNYQNRGGMEALTGKSNFDVSEWMVATLLELLWGREATLAMLCKTSVARKVLLHAWKRGVGPASAEMRGIDASAHFGASVDACLLVCSLSPGISSADWSIFRGLEDDRPVSNLGCREGELVADVPAYERWRHLRGVAARAWRSGVKHDCSKLMELRAEAGLYRNGFGELVELEDDCIYPMLKSSEIARESSSEPARRMLVTQKSVGDDTSMLREVAPKTWEYLESRGALLDRRASRIYRNRPRFSVFGVGPYTFAPWKVAISGFRKSLEFVVVGPYEGRPVVVDDASYFLSCETEEEARFVADLLNSAPAREFYSAYVFWDAKRPITIELLRRLDLRALAGELGCSEASMKLVVEIEARSEGNSVALRNRARGRVARKSNRNRSKGRTPLRRWVGFL